jgi:hypothetical protein
MTVCGDIHHEFLDLFDLFKVCGEDMLPFAYLADLTKEGSRSVHFFSSRGGKGDRIELPEDHEPTRLNRDRRKTFKRLYGWNINDI